MVCPAEPAPLTVDVSTPSEAVEISGRLLIDNHNPHAFACQPNADGACRLLILPLQSAGTYRLEIEFPDTAQMRINDNLVSYIYQPFELILNQGSRQQQFNEQALEALILEFPVRQDESNCLVADFRSIDYSPQPSAAPETEIHLSAGLLMTDLGSDICQQEPIDTPIATELFFAAGTDIGDVQVIYEVAGHRQTADCQVVDDTYLCTAILPNPIIGQSLAIRAITNDQIHTGFQLPFSNLCFYFRN